MATRAFVVAPTPVTRAGLRSMLANAEGTDVRVVGEASSPADPPGLSEADVVLLADDELLEDASVAVAEDGTQAIVLISDGEHAVSRLRAMQLKGWGVVPARRPAGGASGRGRRGRAGADRPAQIPHREAAAVPLRPHRGALRDPDQRASGRSWISWLTASPTGNRRRASHQRAHRQVPHLFPLRQAGREQPRRSRESRRQVRPDLVVEQHGTFRAPCQHAAASFASPRLSAVGLLLLAPSASRRASSAEMRKGHKA